MPLACIPLGIYPVDLGWGRVVKTIATLGRSLNGLDSQPSCKLADVLAEGLDQTSTLRLGPHDIG
jgi:hypothetical protein